MPGTALSTKNRAVTQPDKFVLSWSFSLTGGNRQQTCKQDMKERTTEWCLLWETEQGKDENVSLKGGSQEGFLWEWKPGENQGQIFGEVCSAKALRQGQERQKENQCG